MLVTIENAEAAVVATAGEKLVVYHRGRQVEAAALKVL